MNRFIKKLDDFFQSVSEAFDNPLEIKWIDKKSELIGLFTINNNIYQINCLDKGNYIWKYDFYYLTDDKSFSPDLTGFESDKFRVLPTVRDGMKYLIDNKKVNAIVFGAADDSKGRKKLYESFCIKFSKENDYLFYTKISNNNQIFILYKDSLDLDILSETIIKIIEIEKS